MAKIINLNQHRKKKLGDAKTRRAEENAVRFGRSKTEKARDAVERKRTERDLDGARRDGADPKDGS